MSIRYVFSLVSFLVVISMSLMAYLLWSTGEHIADLGKQLAASKQLKNDMLMLRRHEKDFLLRKNVKYIDKFAQRINTIQSNTSQLKRDLNYAPELQQQLDQAKSLLVAYDDKFEALVKLDVEIGLTSKEGLLADFSLAEKRLKDSVIETQDSQAMASVLNVILLENNFQSTLAPEDKSTVKEHINGAHSYFQRVNLSTQTDIRAFEVAAQRLADALDKRGLDAESGLRGELRSSIHKVESLFGQLSGNLDRTINDELAFAQKKGLSIAVILTTIIAGLMLWQTARVIQRLKVANEKMASISQGGGDLTQHLDLAGEDEVTDLAHSVNDFIDTTAGLVREIKDKGEMVENGAHHSVELNKRSQEAIENQRNNTLAVNEAVKELVASVELIASSANEVQASVSDADSEMTQGSKLMTHAHTQMDELADFISHNSELMTSLNHASNDIGKVTGVIREVTEQTNLLALNAAIEAARAGESGRGFAVVADEVRTLAKRTQASTLEIEQVISTLQQHVADSEKALQQSLELSSQMSGDIKQATDSMLSNKNAMDNIRDMVVQIAGATEEQMYTVKGVEDATRNIHVAAEQLLVDSCENCENCECLEQDAHQMREDVSKFIV